MKLIKKLITPIFFFPLLCLGMDNTIEKDWTQSKFLNTRYLNNHEQVQKDLKKEGFTDEYFPTKDNQLISALFYNPDDAQKTVIFCGGWYPGRKEGMTTFYPMLKDQHCALLFFDARGAIRYSNRGESIKKIKMLAETSNYGEHEYKDILAAIEFVHEKNKRPIYILGICAGAFHASHALMYLHTKNGKDKQSLIDKYNIQGFIFDSGWTSFTNASYVIPRFELQEIFASKIAQCCCIKYHRSKNTVIKRIASPIASVVGMLLHMGVIRKGGLSYIHKTIKNCLKKDKQNNQDYIDRHNTNLIDLWNKYMPNIPILFIHSHDDPTDIKTIQTIAAKSNKATCWWITKPSKHSYNNLIHKEEYRDQLITFFKKEK